MNLYWITTDLRCPGRSATWLVQAVGGAQGRAGPGVDALSLAGGGGFQQPAAPPWGQSAMGEQLLSHTIASFQLIASSICSSSCGLASMGCCSGQFRLGARAELPWEAWFCCKALAWRSRIRSECPAAHTTPRACMTASSPSDSVVRSARIRTQSTIQVDPCK